MYTWVPALHAGTTIPRRTPNTEKLSRGLAGYDKHCRVSVSHRLNSKIESAWFDRLTTSGLLHSRIPSLVERRVLGASVVSNPKRSY